MKGRSRWASPSGSRQQDSKQVAPMVTKCPPCVGLWGCLSVAGVWTLRKQDCRDRPCCRCSR